MTTNNNPGNKFSRCTFPIFNKFIEIPKIKSPPSEDMLWMILSFRYFEIRRAPKVKLDWNINSGIMLNNTPTPKVALRKIEEKPSNVDLTSNNSLLPVIPSSRAPRKVMEPTQNKMNAVTKPSENPASSFEIMCFKAKVPESMTWSRWINSPKTPPSIKLNIICNK